MNKLVQSEVKINIKTIRGKYFVQRFLKLILNKEIKHFLTMGIDRICSVNAASFFFDSAVGRMKIVYRIRNSN